MLTNWITLKSQIEWLKELEQQEVDEIFNLLPKKEASLRLKAIVAGLVGGANNTLN